MLLRTLEKHSYLLDASRGDLKLQAGGVQPCYLVDFDLLYRYLFDIEGKPERTLEIEYILSRSDFLFAIGVGTQIELTRAIYRRLGIDLTRLGQKADLSEYVDALSRHGGEEFLANLQRVVQNARDNLAVQRLNYLLNLNNNLPVSDIGASTPDPDVLRECQRLLDFARPGHSRNNRADSFNIAQVIALRNEVGPYRPYLLTESRHLLDSNFHINLKAYLREAGGFQIDSNGISRTPLAAIYSMVASSCYKSAEEAIEQIEDLERSAETLQLSLKRAYGHLNRVEDKLDDEWETLLRDGEIGTGSFAELKGLASFVREPLIVRTQRIYDSFLQTAANFASQRRHLSSASSPKRIFDLLTSVAKMLEARSAGIGGFDEAWALALEVISDNGDIFDLVTIRDKSATDDKTEGYLEIEFHHNFSLYRWSIDCDVERVLSVFCSAFSRHGVEDLTAQFGTISGEVVEFDATLPVTLNEVISEVDAQVLWVRMNSDHFDLYADILPSPGEDAILGVFVRNEELDHISELHSLTSSRFTFSAWISSALRSAASMRGRYLRKTKESHAHT